MTSQISTEKFDNLCRAYVQSRGCVSSAPECSENIDLFDDIISGLQYACEDEFSSFRKFLPCVEVFVERKDQLIDCETACKVNDSLSHLAYSSEVKKSIIKGGGWLDVLKEAGPTCRSLACYLKCTRMNINQFCGMSGSKLVEMVLRPFERLATQLKLGSAHFEKFLSTSIPPDCRQFTMGKTLDNIRFDEDFLARMRILMATRMKQEITSNHVDSNRVISELLVSSETATRAAVIGWTTTSILYLVFMAFTVLLNVLGLVATVIWCIREKNEKLSRRLGRQSVFHREGGREGARVHFELPEDCEQPRCLKED